MSEQLLDEFLVLASSGNKNIYQLDPKTGRINRLLPVNTPNPVAVAIDMENKDIYYTDVSLAVIGKITVDYFGSKAMTIIHTDNTGTDCLHIRCITQVIVCTHRKHR